MYLKKKKKKISRASRALIKWKSRYFRSCANACSSLSSSLLFTLDICLFYLSSFAAKWAWLSKSGRGRCPRAHAHYLPSGRIGLICTPTGLWWGAASGAPPPPPVPKPLACTTYKRAEFKGGRQPLEPLPLVLTVVIKSL